VADDDISIREFVAEVLTVSGYCVDTREDGSAGWEAIVESAYDLLITDNEMPKFSGLELVQQIRSAGMTLPVVLMSGAIPAEALNQGCLLRLAAVLPKPFTMGELLAVVEKALAANGSIRDPMPIWHGQPTADALSR